MKLVPLGQPGDAWGVATHEQADLDNEICLAPLADWIPATPSLPAASPDPFAGLGNSATSTRFGKINLVAAPRQGYFDGPTSGDVIKLAPLDKGVGLFEAFGPVHADDPPDATFTKGAAADFQKFAQFAKIQETDDGNVVVWGVATHEKPDLDNEICHYDTAKDAYQEWSVAAAKRTSAAGQQISLGPIRYQHSTEPAGKATKIQYDDNAKEIWLGSVPINDEIHGQLKQGYLTGYSQGGSYAWRKCNQCGKSLTLQQANNYCADCKKKVPVTFGMKRLSEVSYVDSPCTGVGFDYVKRDGSTKFVTFAKRAAPSTGRLDGERVLNLVALWFAGWPVFRIT